LVEILGYVQVCGFKSHGWLTGFWLLAEQVFIGNHLANVLNVRRKSKKWGRKG